jgi:HTH-type transcriptional regulator, sugar sensing transcriptional regulator
MSIVQKDFLKKIKDFGLNSYEAKIWTALLSRGVSTAGELSDIANVPRSRSYDILESLEKKGFIIMKIGKPIKYIAVPPEEVVDRVKKNVVLEASRQADLLDTLKDSDILGELKMLHKNGVEMVDPAEITGALKGRNNSYDQMESMIKAAEEEIIIVTTEDGIVRKTDALFRSLKKASERGVKIKVACPITDKNRKALAELSGIATIRDLKGIKARFSIADRKEALFMILDDEQVHPTYDVGIWLNAPFFAQALTQLFDLAWKDAKEVKIKA